jgi:pimeloyl-ACP methyl ester carboxylesterase
MRASARTSAVLAILIVILTGTFAARAGQESLPPLQDGKVPTNLDALWGQYDPRAEPLDVEILKEWEERGVVARIVRYTVGTFKGGTSKVAAFYAFPKGARKLPGLLQIHGGGQSASLASVVADAMNGYASISINWGGNKMSIPTSVEASGQWTGPQTDWGNLDATHPPQRNKVNHFVDGGIPDEYTLDPVPSPRNSNWFLVVIAARRALTFLQQQPEVDPEALGVHGHSMGGRLTTEVAAIDKRVKAAVPSCGGSGVIAETRDDVPLGEPTKLTPDAVATFTTNPYLPRITCPTLWYSASNDFHGLIDSMAWNWRQVPPRLLAFTIPPHYNHRSSPPHQVAAMLWFESHLKGTVKLPKPPALDVQLTAADGIPTVVVTPDSEQTPQGVEVYYS